MSKFQADLSNCDREPIHIPGSIQSWGFLVVVKVSTNIIQYVSANILDYLNITAGSVLGQPLSAFEAQISGRENKNPLSAFVEAAKRKQEAEAYEVQIEETFFDLLIHTFGQHIYLEFESKSPLSGLNIHNQIGRHVSNILATNNLSDILDRAAVIIKQLIGYDRVMIYKFMEDAHGKVVAEARNEELDPFLGLHYPASDIPAQARQLYKLNKMRLIADVNAPTSSLLAMTDVPLDLSHSVLRAVSPLHIQYLKNMEVASSFSVSLMCKGELWGLISCHHYTPKFINHRLREGARLLGQIISSSIEFKEEEMVNAEQKKHKAVFEKIISELRTGTDIKDAVLNPSVSFKDIVKAEGVFMRYEGRTLKDGRTPSEEQIESIIQWLSETKEASVFQTNKLVDLLPAAKEFAAVASGILACTISRELREYIIWFRPEYMQSITWAGNPEKPVELDEKGEQRISPRKSFENFRTIVENTAERWKAYEQHLAERFKEELLYIINKKASEIRALNEKLKEAYDELETFSSTISHDLKTPLAVIKSYAQLLERNKTLDDQGKQFAARISVGIQRMNTLIAEVLDYSKIGRAEINFQPIDMASLLSTIKNEVGTAFNNPNLVFSIGNTPPVSGDQTMIYQVFLNLISNAVKYSHLSVPSIVTVEGSENEFEVVYKVEDNGIGIDPKHYNKVFELFKRVNVQSDYEGTGVGLAIVKRILEKHKATIWIEGRPGIGSIFWIKFRKFE
ncbi:ATP-binding protein [Pedobacter sp. SYSU D00535]|uniref:ATP-binding protein n=1 Tax=Pedobacter sp. SYSU D00535 TaxID=2810308 RepID=UPI001A961660|nr:ATP-binding protein [Pedobacter sp. SYSU D00535]